MPNDVIYVQKAPSDEESVVVLARDGIVIWKHQEAMTAQHLNKIVGQLSSLARGDYDVRYIDTPEGVRRSEKVRKVNSWDEEQWKGLDPNKPTHEQITPDNKLIGIDLTPPDAELNKGVAIVVDLEVD